MQYVLAGASSTGYTVVWDLQGKRELLLWRTVVEQGHWLVKSVLEAGWLLEEDAG